MHNFFKKIISNLLVFEPYLLKQPLLMLDHQTVFPFCETFHLKIIYASSLQVI